MERFEVNIIFKRKKDIGGLIIIPGIGFESEGKDSFYPLLEDKKISLKFKSVLQAKFDSVNWKRITKRVNNMLNYIIEDLECFNRFEERAVLKSNGIYLKSDYIFELSYLENFIEQHMGICIHDLFNDFLNIEEALNRIEPVSVKKHVYEEE